MSPMRMPVPGSVMGEEASGTARHEPWTATRARSPSDTPRSPTCQAEGRGSLLQMRIDAPVFLIAAGHAHPDQVVLSEELERRIPGVAVGWSEQRLGIRSRRILSVGERAVDLTISALLRALEQTDLEPSQIHAVVNGGTFTDQVAPAGAALIAARVNTRAIALDVNTVCASFLFALGTAVGLMAINQDLDLVAVCATEHPTAHADYTERNSSIFWGDAGAAMILSRAPLSTGSFRVVDIELNGDHRHPERVYTPHGGHFRSDGPYSKAALIDLCQRACTAVLERNGHTIGDVRVLVAHQANLGVLQSLGGALGVPWDRQWHNFEWAGNQAGAGVATAFSEGWKENGHTLASGDLVLLTATGGGYSGAAVLLERV